MMSLFQLPSRMSHPSESSNWKFYTTSLGFRCVPAKPMSCDISTLHKMENIFNEEGPLKMIIFFNLRKININKVEIN